ncbi:MAG: ammonium transporter [Candidatus Anammoxibacter sp.]
MVYIFNRLSKSCVAFSALFLLCLILFSSNTVFAGDPSGTETFTETIAGLTLSINFVWVLICAFLIYQMQAGFAFLGGFLQSKNMLGYLAHCFTDGTMGLLIFWMFGFALMFGGSGLAPGLESGNSFIGYSGFFLTGGSYDVQATLLWLFQMVFATKAVTIIAGGVAERIKYAPYVIYSICVVGFVYPIYGHWVWGGGWLGDLGMLDFAGGATIHTIGGVLALVGAYFLGARKKKYNPDGTPNAIPGHNLTLVVIGTLMLAFGWFAFNAGSTLAATDLRISVVAVNTALGGAAGAVVVLFLSYAKFGFADIGLACNGLLAGLVAITGPCAWVPTWAAVIIGVVAGLLMWGTVWFVEVKLRIDDPLGAVAVHGANGIWGTLALGIFADGTYGGVRGLIVGSGSQLLYQFIGIVVAIAWALVVGGVIFYVLKKTIGLRVSELVEYEGVDIHLHGSPCYPVQDEVTVQLGSQQEEVQIEQELALLEEAFSKSSDRERIYSAKLGKWIYAKPKK